MAVARALITNPAVEAVRYPGLPSHAGHDVATKADERFWWHVVDSNQKGGRERAIQVASVSMAFHEMQRAWEG